MNVNQSILTLILLTPLAGSVILAFLPQRGNVHKWGALIVTLLTFVLTLHLPMHFGDALPAVAENASQAGMQQFHFELNRIWIPAPLIRYHVGVDGLSMWLVVLSGFLAPLGVLASWNTIADRCKLFYCLFLGLQVALMGVFVSLDLFLFYAFFEGVLVPTALLIAIYGRTGNRQKAALKYFLYNFIPSALLLVGIVWLYSRTNTFQLPILQQMAAQHRIHASHAGLWFASLSLLLAFAVKVPIFPLHGWLSDSISEAPTAVVMVLAGKVGLYSILRFSFGIFPEESHRIAPLLIALGAIGIVYGACVALVQSDLKRLASYSTLGHLSFITLGIFTFTVNGLDGGMYQILNHGISGGALFLLMGFLYERYGTYDMRELGGISGRMPWMVTLFVTTALSNVGLPMLNSFVGEFLILSGTASNTLVAHPWLWTTIATTGVIFAAAYLLTMIQRTFYANLGAAPSEIAGWDMTTREHAALWPMVALFLYMGLSSPSFMRFLDPIGLQYAGRHAAAPGQPETSEAETYSSLPAKTFVASEARAGETR